jgi:hypothetical protein
MRYIGKSAVSQCHTCVNSKRKKIVFLRKQIFSIVFSNGDVQLECQCKSSTTWNGVAVSIYKFKMNTKSSH